MSSGNPFAAAITQGLGGLNTSIQDRLRKDRVSALLEAAQSGDEQALAELATLEPNAAEVLMSGQTQRAKQTQLAQETQLTQEKEAQNLKFRKMANIAMTAKSLEDPVKIRAYLQNELRQEQDPDIKNEILDSLNMSDDQLVFDLDSAIASAQANLGELVSLGADKKGVQFGAQQTFKDSQGNLFFGTQKRDAQTGATESTLSPIGNAPDQPVGQVQMVGTFGETAKESLERKLAEAKAKADIDLETDISKLTGKKREERIDAVIDTGIASVSVIPTYDRMLELIDVVSTGGIQAGIQRARQLFGWEAADLAELDALFKESVLGNIKQLGANPTEGERKFIVEASGSIGQNPAVLKRLITRRKKEAVSAVEKGLKFANQRGDDDALFLLKDKSTPSAKFLLKDNSTPSANKAQVSDFSSLSDDELLQEIRRLEGNQ